MPMPPETPIACSLTAAQMPARLAEMADIGRASLLGVDTVGRQAALRFRAIPRTRERLEAIVIAESQCCAFLTFDLRDVSEGIELTVTGPAGAEPILDDLVAAFSTETDRA
jgi:hypothetical protein